METVSHLAGLGALGVKLDLLHGQFPASVGIVAEEDTAKGSLAQQLAQTPVGGRPRGCVEERRATLEP